MALLNQGPAGPVPTSGGSPGGPEQRSRYDFSQPPKKRRPWLIPLLVLLAVVAVVAVVAVATIYQAGQRSAATVGAQTPGSSGSGTASMVMPNFVGTATIQSAANQLRATLGQGLNVQAAGGVSVANQIVGSQYPPAGQTVHSLSAVTFYPRASATTAPTYTAQPAQPAQPTGTYTAGTYVVGSDIEPGTYRTTGPTSGSGCYWARLEDTTGDFSSIITNGNTQGPATLTIQASDGAVKLSGSCTWSRR